MNVNVNVNVIQKQRNFSQGAHFNGSGLCLKRLIRDSFQWTISVRMSQSPAIDNYCESFKDLNLT